MTFLYAWANPPPPPGHSLSTRSECHTVMSVSLGGLRGGALSPVLAWGRGGS